MFYLQWIKARYFIWMDKVSSWNIGKVLNCDYVLPRTPPTQITQAVSFSFLFFFFANREYRTPECLTAISFNSRWILSMIIDCTEYFRCRQCHMQASPFGIESKTGTNSLVFFPRRFFGLYVQYSHFYCWYFLLSSLLLLLLLFWINLLLPMK